MSRTEHTDALVIVGAGPAGSAAAIEAGRRGLPCVLLDKARFPRDKVCGDALSGKAVDGLKRLGINPEVDLCGQATALPSWGIEFAAPSGERLRVPFKRDYQPANEMPPGFLMPRFDFDSWLLDHALRYAGVDFRPGVEVKSARREPDGRIMLEARDGSTLKARWVVAADGAHSPTRKLIDSRPWQARQHCAGLRAYYDGVSGLCSDGFIELHFLQELLPGYLWIFPLPNGRANVGLGMRSDVVSRRRLNLRKILDGLLQDHPNFRGRFNRARRVGAFAGMGLPLGGKWPQLYDSGVFRTGDAASLIDPFTGEGIGNALQSGRLAAQQFALALEPENFNPKPLHEYSALLRSKLQTELRVSAWLQKLTTWQWLFNRVVKQANKHSELQDVLVSMFEDVDLRRSLTRPSFYLKWIVG